MSANTSPDNITYPTSGDNVAPLETVFATMASSVQTALTGRFANAQAYEFRWTNAAARTAQTGMRAGDTGYQIDTAVNYYYNGSAWTVYVYLSAAPLSGLNPVIPTSATGTNVTLNTTTGRVLVNSAGGSLITIQGCFSSASKYRIEIPRVVSSGVASLQVRLLNGGTAISTATYDYDINYRSGSTPTAALTSGATSLVLSGGSTQPTKFGWLEVYYPSTAIATGFDWKLNETPTAGVSLGQGMGTGYQRDTTPYDGIQFILSAGTFSYAEIQVYSYL